MIVRPRHAGDLPACAAALRLVHEHDTGWEGRQKRLDGPGE
ncbi:hypothetical protein [Paractinoplanes ovalisporus]|nr:hypothetical protein [Actinoplanes ovalisporus]